MTADELAKILAKPGYAVSGAITSTRRVPEAMKLVAGIVMPDTAPKKRLRQKSGPKLNPTEAAFGEHLEATLANHDHYAQAVTFVLANGVRYTPDWVSISSVTGVWIVHEVKGYMRDDAAVKIKVAAGRYPLVKWRLATKRRKKDGGGWAVEPVLP